MPSRIRQLLQCIHIFEADDQVATWFKPAAAIFALRDRLYVLLVPTVGNDHRIGAGERIVFERRQGCFRDGASDEHFPVRRKQAQQPPLRLVEELDRVQI